jgi:hypothetical protein
MRIRLLPGSVMALALLLSACRETKLEHFKFYSVAEQPMGTFEGRITVKGQFESSFKPATVLRLAYFGNPVSKIRTTPTPTPTPADEPPPEPPGEEEIPPPPPQPGPLANPNHHLTWYALDPKEGEKEPARYVKLIDQFGTKELILGPPVALLLPAHKLEGGGQPPVGLNHFKCYDITRHRGVTREMVMLQDQFDRPNVKVTFLDGPDFFCLPVEKRRGRRSHKIERNTDRFNHLLIYRVQSEDYPGVRKSVTDQLQEKVALSEFRARYLAVPADKRIAQEGHEFPSAPPPTPTPN